MERLIKGINMSYHTPLYLEGYGQARQKKLDFGRKWPFLG